MENSQAAFAESAGVEQSTVSRWKNHGIPPTFENCLRIAKAMNKHPMMIFEAAGHPEFEDIFRFFSPDYQPTEPQLPVAETSEDRQLLRDFHEMTDEMKAFVVKKLKECIEFDQSWNPHKEQRDIK